MRKLICCPSCNRQFDATRLAVGSRFRCRCGAAREEGSRARGYRGSDFTIHEQDLETTCPACFARISNPARFCHHCGTATAPEAVAADPTERISDEREQQEDRARASQLKFKVEPKVPENARRAILADPDREPGFDAIPSIVNWLLKL